MKRSIIIIIMCMFTIVTLFSCNKDDKFEMTEVDSQIMATDSVHDCYIEILSGSNLSRASIEIITSLEAFNEFIKNHDNVVVFYWAPWNGVSYIMSPIIDELAEYYDGKVYFAKINIDKNPEIELEHRISTLPVTRLYWKGRMVQEILGLQTKQYLSDRIQLYLDVK